MRQDKRMSFFFLKAQSRQDIDAKDKQMISFVISNYE